jgi:hypothetical protein
MFKQQGREPPQKEQVVSNWLSSPCMKIDGVVITRRDIVRYVANKLGGVHLDTKRNEIKDMGFLALDRVRNGVRVIDLDAVYAEMTAIGQQFAKAIDSASSHGADESAGVG